MSHPNVVDRQLVDLPMFTKEHIALRVFQYPLPSGVDSLGSWKRSSDSRFQNLLREFITWRQLSHPNVLPLGNPILPCVSLDGAWECSRILGSPESYGFLHRCHQLVRRFHNIWYSIFHGRFILI